VIVPRTSAVVN